MKSLIEGTFSAELSSMLEKRKDDLEEKVTSHILEKDDYPYSLGYLHALRWCIEELGTLEKKFYQ